jgi:serine/threonine protein kinase
VALKPPRRAAPEPDGSARDERGLINRLIADKYIVRSIIGSGGVGTVYEAIDRTLRRSVAIKVPMRSANEIVIKRFLREGRAGAAIAHPNVCALYDFGPLDDGTPFLVMERLFGETLADRLERERTLPLLDTATIMVQVLAGLGAAHSRGIVHRDMKPENIFLCRPAGGESIVKVLDFGASKLDRFSPAGEDHLEDLTATGFAVGTPYYMAPEQARGARELDGRLDIFACGTIVYEVLTGVRPFEGKHFKEVFTAITEANPTPARVVNPELPRAVDEVLKRAMARRPDDRYPSAEAFARAMESLKLATRSPMESASDEPTTERLAYLRQRFHELSVLYRRKGEDGRKKVRAPSNTAVPTNKRASVDIPIFFDDEEPVMAPAKSPAVVPRLDEDDDMEETQRRDLSDAAAFGPPASRFPSSRPPPPAPPVSGARRRTRR